MIYVSNIQQVAPQTYSFSLQESVYQTLKLLHIPFQRVDTDEVITMEDCIRVSFVSAEKMETMLGTKIGAAAVFSAVMDKNNEIQIVIDKDVAVEEWYGCSDGTTTGYMKIQTVQVIHNFLPHTKHTPAIIEV